MENQVVLTGEKANLYNRLISGLKKIESDIGVDYNFSFLANTTTELTQKLYEHDTLIRECGDYLKVNDIEYPSKGEVGNVRNIILNALGTLSTTLEVSNRGFEIKYITEILNVVSFFAQSIVKEE